MRPNFLPNQLTNTIAKAIGPAMLAFLAVAVSPAVPAMNAPSATPVSADDAATQNGDKWRGTANCTVECTDGKCISIRVSCSAEASYEAARSKLKSKIQAKASSLGGKVKGSISFSISKSFAPEQTARGDEYNNGMAKEAVYQNVHIERSGGKLWLRNIGIVDCTVTVQLIQGNNIVYKTFVVRAGSRVHVPRNFKRFQIVAERPHDN